MNPGTFFPLAQTCLVLLHLEDSDTFITILLHLLYSIKSTFTITLNCLVHKQLEL
jgi:hypothetical protein